MENTTTTQQAAAYQQTHPTSPWTEWADKFASPAFANGNHAQQGSQAQSEASDRPCSDALMDCYNG
jgi:hypothetical protein